MDSLSMKIFGPAATLLANTFALLLIRFATYRAMHVWVKKTATKLDDIIIDSIKNPSLLFAVATGAYISLSFSEIPENHMSYIDKILNAVIILSMTFALATLAGQLFKNYVQTSNILVPTTGLAYGILKGIIFVIGFLIILNDLGISIAPLITALGVGGLAVVLALQDTLANIFAGAHILVEKSIRMGDFVKLESGQVGYVDDNTHNRWISGAHEKRPIFLRGRHEFFN
jgi:small-conductance mechanosensitive channel